MANSDGAPPPTRSTTTRTRRGSRATLPITDHPDSPEFRALIEHSIEAYADPSRRFRLSPREIRDTADGLRGHAQRLGLPIPHYLESWGTGGSGSDHAEGLYPDIGIIEDDATQDAGTPAR